MRKKLFPCTLTLCIDGRSGPGFGRWQWAHLSYTMPGKPRLQSWRVILGPFALAWYNRDDRELVSKRNGWTDG